MKLLSKRPVLEEDVPCLHTSSVNCPLMLHVVRRGVRDDEAVECDRRGRVLRVDRKRLTTPAPRATLASPSLRAQSRYPSSSVRQSVSICCQNTGEGQRFRASH